MRSNLDKQARNSFSQDEKEEQKLLVGSGDAMQKLTSPSMKIPASSQQRVSVSTTDVTTEQRTSILSINNDKRVSFLSLTNDKRISWMTTETLGSWNPQQQEIQEMPQLENEQEEAQSDDPSPNEEEVVEDDNRERSRTNLASKKQRKKRKRKNKQKSAVKIDLTKFKTEMCKNWSETGKCNYGKKCQFAHGKHELHQPILMQNDRYKSKNCRNYFFFDVLININYVCQSCPYGARCQFLHESRDVTDIQKEYYYQRKLVDIVYTINIVDEDDQLQNTFVFTAFDQKVRRSESLRGFDERKYRHAKTSQSEERINVPEDGWSDYVGQKINFKNWLESLKKGLLLHVSMTTSDSGSKVSQSDAHSQ